MQFVTPSAPDLAGRAQYVSFLIFYQFVFLIKFCQQLVEVCYVANVALSFPVIVCSARRFSSLKSKASDRDASGNS